MGENSKIQWTHHTFNPWWGCDRVSPACDNCYAETWARRCGLTDLWSGARRFFGDKHWNEPRKLDRNAAKRGVRERVFCASMADVFDNHPEVGPHRERLWTLIRETPNLDWLLLTKRIGNAKRMLPADWCDGYPNVWLGISVVTQDEADRDIPKLLATPARIRFLSCEPLVERIQFPLPCHNSVFWSGLHWIIVGGESGSKARPMSAQWASEIREQCAKAGAAFFMKQGSRANWPHYEIFESFPMDLQVREWPSH
jgi:protein gp37